MGAFPDPCLMDVPILLLLIDRTLTVWLDLSDTPCIHMYRINRRQHNVDTVQVWKVALQSYYEKWYILGDGLKTRAHHVQFVVVLYICSDAGNICKYVETLMLLGRFFVFPLVVLLTRYYIVAIRALLRP